MRGIYDQITKLNLRHRVRFDFPKLSIERIKELRNKFITKGSDFIDKQVLAKKQLELKKIPASHVSFKFSGPILFKITKDQVFQPLSARVFKQKIQRSEIINHLNKLSSYIKRYRILVKYIQTLNLLHVPCVAEPLEVN